VPFAAPVTLTGQLVSLTPTSPDDAEQLGDAARDGELWTLGYTAVPRPEEMADAIAWRLEQQRLGTMLPFTARHADTGVAFGMTTYCHIDAANRRVEIGHTWNARSVQRSGTNTESKLLLLGHAFETLDCIAVEFRTHFLNRQSRAAIERLGARLDGILRHHQVMADGTLRDTVVYSITAPEWPAIRNELRRRLAQH
jgi:N-acetyltransferase